MKGAGGLLFLALTLVLFYYLAPLMLLFFIFAFPIALLIIAGYLVYKKIPKDSKERKEMRKRIRRMLKKNLSYLR